MFLEICNFLIYYRLQIVSHDILITYNQFERKNQKDMLCLKKIKIIVKRIKTNFINLFIIYINEYRNLNL